MTFWDLQIHRPRKLSNGSSEIYNAAIESVTSKSEFMDNLKNNSTRQSSGFHSGSASPVTLTRVTQVNESTSSYGSAGYYTATETSTVSTGVSTVLSPPDRADCFNPGIAGLHVVYCQKTGSDTVRNLVAKFSNNMNERGFPVEVQTMRNVRVGQLSNPIGEFGGRHKCIVFFAGVEDSGHLPAYADELMQSLLSERFRPECYRIRYTVYGFGHTQLPGHVLDSRLEQYGFRRLMDPVFGQPATDLDDRFQEFIVDFLHAVHFDAKDFD